MALGPGSIAFTGFNADGNDNISFVALTDIAAGATIHFTDNAWSGTAFVPGESAFSWTASSDITAGTIITIDTINDPAPTSNLGTVVYTDISNTGLSNGNEVLYAYVGTPATPTAFLAAIANNGFNAGNGVLDNTGLTLGTHAINLGAINDGTDIGEYTGARSGQASLSDYLLLINNNANWIAQDAGGDQSIDTIPPDLPFSTTTFVVGNPQIVGFAAGSTALSIAEGDAGTTVFTFSVERTGGTVGQVDFSGTFGPGNTDDDDFGGTSPIGFSGTILDGAASGIVEITVSGDTVFEAGEQFTLTLTSATNPDEDVSLGVVTATGTIVNDDPEPTVIANGETVNAMITLTGADTLTIQNGGTLDVPALGNPAAVKILGPATAVLLDNSGFISSDTSRTIDAEFTAGQDGNATIWNRATGVITQDAANADRVIEISGTMNPGTVFTINNEGQIIAPERAIDTNSLTGDFVLNNYATGTIESAAGSEAFRGTGVINNWGIIRERVEGLTFDQAAIDFQSHAGGVVNNYSAGLIEGSRHGITGDLPVTLTNEVDATVRGRNGSGINLDTTSSDPVALVTNRGLISGNYNGGGDGDGDGVDVDGLLTLHNYGRVEGTGADNVANFADGVAAGGGEIHNYAGAEIFGESRGILIDDSNLGAAFAAALIVNQGTIGVSLGPAIRMIGDWNDTIINSGRINGDVDMGGGDDEFDGSAGKAVVGTVTGGAGVDTLTGSKFADTFDGGDGNDTLAGNGGNDVLDGGGDSDTINGGKGNDQIDGGTGNDVLSGDEGSDGLLGGDGDDTLNGGNGNDSLDGGGDTDAIDGGKGNDTIDGGEGSDTLSGDDGKDTISGGGGNDDLAGGNGNDSLAGGEGDDTLDGGQGMDILTGGIGRDVATGGAGADHFVFGPGDLVAGPLFDEIADFKHSQKDRIDLSAIDAIDGSGDDAFNFIGASAFTGNAGELHHVAGVGQVTVEGDTNGDAVADFSITVLGVASLLANDFIDNTGGGDT